MRLSVIFAVCILAMSAPALARPLEPGDIPATAQVVVHVDVDALQKSKTRAMFDKQVDDLKAEVNSELNLEGIPFKVSDLARATGVTFWAEGDEAEHGALIVRGLDIKRMITALGAVKGYRLSNRGGHAIHQIDNGDETTYIGIRGATLVIADDSKSVETSLDVLAGRATSLARSAKAARLGKARGVLFAAVFEQKIAEKIQREANSGIFKKIKFKGGLIYARESTDKLIARAVIETSDAAGANQLHKLAAGAIAFFDIASDDPDLATLLDAVKIQSSNATVTFTLALPFATIEKLIPVIDSKRKDHDHERGHGAGSDVTGNAP
ncbi:MAG: hypothetical protein MJE77_01730 [Proteobacteria bacterium]|nr:hypothetical protein [Pseudomonadota bacterium]